MQKIFLLLLSIAFFLNSCSSDHDKQLKISATTWIGYAPFFYAKEKGWLKPLNIKLIHLTSLAENMYLYKAGNSDAYTATQYEYGVLHKDMKSLTPVMLLDRSNGGDLVMSNLSIDELKNEKEIDVYLEIDSINSTVLKDFLSHNGLKGTKINYINSDQTKIELLHATKKPTLIVTYIPYDLSLKKQGFKEIASTKSSLNLLVVDALFTKAETLKAHKKQFEELKLLINKSIKDLQTNPKEFYETIKPYILEMSYKDFLDSVNDIVWINQNLSPALKTRMKESNLPTRDLL